ncbi:MAG: hypothetical protein ACOY0T_31585 [Myxococcota bacterium]
MIARRLAFDHASLSLVLGGVERRPEALPDVFVRALDAERYTSISELISSRIGDTLHTRLAITSWCTTELTLFCAVAQATHAEPNVHALRHIRLARVTLPDLQCTSWEEEHGSLDGLVISELVAARNNSTLDGVTGFRSPIGGSVSYFVTTFDWKSGAVARIGAMPDVFF